MNFAPQTVGAVRASLSSLTGHPVPEGALKAWSSANAVQTLRAQELATALPPANAGLMYGALAVAIGAVLFGAARAVGLLTHHVRGGRVQAIQAAQPYGPTGDTWTLLRELESAKLQAVGFHRHFAQRGNAKVSVHDALFNELYPVAIVGPFDRVQEKFMSLIRDSLHQQIRDVEHLNALLAAQGGAAQGLNPHPVVHRLRPEPGPGFDRTGYLVQLTESGEQLIVQPTEFGPDGRPLGVALRYSPNVRDVATARAFLRETPPRRGKHLVWTLNANQPRGRHR